MFKQNASFNVLYTANIQLTSQFYQKLGVTIKEQADDKVVVTCGDFELHYILNTTEPFEIYRYIAEPTHYGHGVIFYLEADNITVAVEKIRAAGGKIIAPVFDNLWGCKEVLFEDPNGYKFAIYQQQV